MKSGKLLFKKLTGVIVAAVFFAACLCMGFSAEAGYSPKYWYDKDGLFHEQHNSHAYAKDEKGVFHKEYTFIRHRGDKHIWFDDKGERHEEWK